MSDQQAPQVKMMNVGDLRPYPGNPRKHGPDIDFLVKSVAAFGWTNPILVQKGTGRVIAGHGRLLAAQKAGIKRVPCIELDYDDRKASAYTIADNKSAELGGGWDFAILKDQLLELNDGEFDISLTGFSEDELGELLDLGAMGTGHEDDAPEPPKKPVSKLGQAWALGHHRLVCGDSTDEAVVAQLFSRDFNPAEQPEADTRAAMIFADPPYGVSYADKNKFLNAIARGNRIQEPIVGDHAEPAEMKSFWVKAFTLACAVVRDGGAYYVTGPQGGDLLLLLLLALRESGFELKHMLIWAKNNHVLGRCDYHYQHEPIIYGWKGGAGHKFYGGRSQTSLWQIDKPVKSDLHPTMKPVELVERAIRNSSRKGEIVYDAFLGSGTTLIAAEKTGRRCFACELDPRYCDVIINRWEKYTGQKAVLMDELPQPRASRGRPKKAARG